MEFRGILAPRNITPRNAHGTRRIGGEPMISDARRLAANLGLAIAAYISMPPIE